MARYVVKFFKHVVGENGQAVSSCQDAFEIEGGTALEAAELGKAKFYEHGDADGYRERLGAFREQLRVEAAPN